MSHTILVTGYEPFGGRDVNPTEQIVTALAGRSVPGVELRTAVLPVVYDECVDALLAAMERHEPAAVIACGLAAGRTAVTPERVAINVKGTSQPAEPDNAGNRPLDEPIGDGPDGLFATLPVRAVQRALVAAGIPSSVSDSTGSFICNNTMYGVLDHLRRKRSSTLAGFIHFPASADMALSEPTLPSLPLETMERALLIAVETVAEYLPGRLQPEASSGL